MAAPVTGHPAHARGRLVVRWKSMGFYRYITQVVQAIKAAIRKCSAPGILNADQGCKFTSRTYKNILRQSSIIQNVDGKSRWADNIKIERWFHSLKKEEIHFNEYAKPKALLSGSA